MKLWCWGESRKKKEGWTWNLIGERGEEDRRGRGGGGEGGSGGWLSMREVKWAIKRVYGRKKWSMGREGESTVLSNMKHI